MTLLRRWRWPLAGLLLLALAMTGLALGLPPLLQQQIETRGSALLGRSLQLREVAVSLPRLAVTLRGLQVGAAPGDADSTPQFAIEQLEVDLSLRSLLRLAPVVEALRIEQPRLRLARLAEGGLDVDDIIARVQAAAPAPDPAAEPARFALFNVELKDGELLLDDRLVGRRHALQALQLALPFLSNLPEDIPVQVQPRLAFQLAGAGVDLTGRSLPFSTDRASELQLRWDALPLDPFWAYLPRQLGLQPQGGRLDAQLALRFAQPPGQTPTLALSGQLALHDLALAGAVPGTGLTLQRLALGLDDVQPVRRRVALGELRIDGLALALQRDAQGRLAGPGPAAAAAPERAPAARPAAGPGPGPAASAPAAQGVPDGAGGWQLSLRRIALQGSQVTLADAAVSPAARWALQDLAFTADAVAWPAQAPWPVQAQAQLLATHAGAPPAAATLAVRGQVAPTQAQLAIDLSQVQLAAAAPYLRPWLRPQLAGIAALQAQVDWAEGAEPRLQVAVAQADITGLRLAPAAAPPAPRGQPRPQAAPPLRPLAQLARLTVQDLQLDLLARRASLGQLRLDQPELALVRSAAGAIDLPGGWRAGPEPAGPEPASAPPANAPAGPAWTLALGRLQLDRGRLHWRDDQPAAPVDQHWQGLKLHLQDLSWPARPRPARFDFAAQLAAPGAADAEAPPGPRRPGAAGTPAQLQASGTLGLAPWALRASLAVERLPLQRFEPYFRSLLPVKLARGEIGWQGRISASLPADGSIAGLALEATGPLLLADLDVRTPADAAALAAGNEDEALLSWASLQLRPLRVALAPRALPQVEIGEAVLTDFYSRLVITEQGRFNLRDVAAAPATGPAAAAAAPAAAPAPVPAASAPPAPAALPLDIVVGATRLSGGRVDFTDRFVRPNYSAELTELSGAIGRFASRTPADLATVDLRGRVAGTGRLEIRGALNPTANPLALDLQARTTDLELAPLSPYSGKYAGYAIERGKLSVDLAYKVAPDGKLEARNQIILNQLTFGAAVDSPEATKLPVRLAVALLSDRNGVIDLDLPVSGSINDPQFSVWGIVWKILGNLLSKALTSPFALLSAGGADDLSSIAFVPGTPRLADSGQAAIDKIAKALQDRPALRLTLSGHADPVAEKAAVQAAAIDARLLAEQRRDLARSGAPAEAAGAAPPVLGTAESARLLKRLYTDTPLPDRPRNVVGLLKDVPPAEMRARLEAAVPVTPDTARDLALQRSLRVRDALIERGLASERLFLGAPKVGPAPASAPAAAAAASAPAAAGGPRVELSLALP